MLVRQLSVTRNVKYIMQWNGVDPTIQAFGDLKSTLRMVTHLYVRKMSSLRVFCGLLVLYLRMWCHWI